MSGEPANEDQIRELISRMQMFQQRMEALQQQASLVQMSLQDMDNALKALSALEGQKAGHEMLVPIGAGSYVHATISSPDHVLVNLGSGVSMEKSVADSKSVLQSRRTDLEKVLLETTGAMEQTENELMRLQQEAEKYR
jgi:prefoldin alpha subunit